MIKVLDIPMKNWNCPQCKVGYEKGYGLVNASPPEEKWYDSDDGKYIYCRKCEIYWSESEIMRGEAIMSKNDDDKNQDLSEFSDGRIKNEEETLESLEKAEENKNKKPESDINKFEMYRVMDWEQMKIDLEEHKAIVAGLREKIKEKESPTNENINPEDLLKEVLICLHVNLKPVLDRKADLDEYRSSLIKGAMDRVAIAVMGNSMFYDEEDDTTMEHLELSEEEINEVLEQKTS